MRRTAGRISHRRIVPLCKRRRQPAAGRFRVLRPISAAASRQKTLPVQSAAGAPPRPAAPGGATVIAGLPPEDQPEGGPAKQLPTQFRRQLVNYVTAEPAGTIIIDTPHTYLYLVLGGGKALRYGVGVGRDGFTWAGTERISRMSRMAGLASAEGDDRASALSAALHGRRRR